MSPDTPALSPDPVSPSPAGAWPKPAPRAADLLDRVVAAGDLEQQALAPPPWLWQGYLGPGKVTLLTSQWKSGKTTLVALLLARLQQGGQLAGLPVTQGKALVISEESLNDWRPRFQHLAIRGHVSLLCRPFTTQPTIDQWLALVDTAAAWHDRQGCDLVVFDALAHFLPAHSENSAGALLECLTPLQRLATAGMAVLLVHHPHKGKTMAGQAARGSGALPSFVDILLEMAYYRRPDDRDRRRRLLAFSRYDETPRHLLLELQADGSDYVVVQGSAEAVLGEGWQAVLDLLAQAHHKLTRQEILDNWPGDDAKPRASTVWRWLSQAAEYGHVRQEGTGRPGDPFRYWLPERQELMRPDDGTREEMQAWNDRCMAEVFARLKPASEGVRSADEDTPPAEPATAADQTVSKTEPASPPPEPLPSPAAEPPVRLPYPYNIMNPEDVPEAVWNRARCEKGSGVVPA